MEKTVSEFLTILKVPVSNSYVEKNIASHADYPSLLSIADVFERLGIPYCASRTSFDKLKSTAFPYLLPLPTGGGDILLVRNEKDLKDNEDILGLWEGVIFQAESTDRIVDKQSNLYYKKERLSKRLTLTLLSCFGLLFLFSVLNSALWTNLLLASTSIAGLIIGYFLVAKDLGIKYKAIESFCNDGKNTNCDKVLNSEGAWILGVIKFSDAVLSYFLFQTILLSVSAALANANEILFLLGIASLLTLPIVVYSVYYQYFKAKTWCKLCLVIDGILLIQSVLFAYALYMNPIGISWTSSAALTILSTGLLFVSLSILIVRVKQGVEDKNKAEQSQVTAMRLKNSVSVFATLLAQEPQTDTTLFHNEVLIGNPDAAVKITMASNLYCNPCKEQHEKAAELIANFPDKVNLSIRFLLSGKDMGEGVTTNQHLLQYWIDNIRGRDQESLLTEKLIHSWYSMMDLKKFQAKYPVAEISAAVKKLEQLHLEWISSSSVHRTPTFFINGIKLPKDYTIEDLTVMIPGLDELFTKASNTFQLVKANEPSIATY